jgi:hypothetical protein
MGLDVVALTHMGSQTCAYIGISVYRGMAVLFAKGGERGKGQWMPVRTSYVGEDASCQHVIKASQHVARSHETVEQYLWLGASTHVSVCVCVCVCVCARARVFVRVCMRASLRVRVHVCMCVWARTGVSARTRGVCVPTQSACACTETSQCLHLSSVSTAPDGFSNHPTGVSQTQ